MNLLALSFSTELIIFCSIMVGAGLLTCIVSAGYLLHDRALRQKLFTKEKIERYEAELAEYFSEYNILNILQCDTMENFCKMFGATLIPSYTHREDITVTKTDDGYTIAVRYDLSVRYQRYIVARELAKLIIAELREKNPNATLTNQDKDVSRYMISYIARALLIPMDALVTRLRASNWESMKAVEREWLMHILCEEYKIDESKMVDRLVDHNTLIEER